MKREPQTKSSYNTTGTRRAREAPSGVISSAHPRTSTPALAASMVQVSALIGGYGPSSRTRQQAERALPPDAVAVIPLGAAARAFVANLHYSGKSPPRLRTRRRPCGGTLATTP